MTYNVDELFRFEKVWGRYILAEYIQKDNTEITEIAIPAEYCGKPVAEIGDEAFRRSLHLQKVTVPEGIRRICGRAFVGCESLRRVSFPASLEALGIHSFAFCTELCDVEFRSDPSFEMCVFAYDIKLPAELVLASELQSLDLTRAFYEDVLYNETCSTIVPSMSWLLHRPDVLALAAKNNCFRDISEPQLLQFFSKLIEHDCMEQLRIAGENDVFNGALLDELTEYSVRQNKPEITAYLLDLKKRKFGFMPESEFDL
ncbi:MAG: leucine-rich repeat domain-containing protein [Oscillospiraceae bacterium]|nr:leucine-rich repeat domain-containing protein [Oscillospiraceae bacterium]